MQLLGSSNVTYKCSTMRPGNPFILGSKGQSEGQEVCKPCRRGLLSSFGCQLLLFPFQDYFASFPVSFPYHHFSAVTWHPVAVTWRSERNICVIFDSGLFPALCETWRRPQNRKYLTHCIAVRGGSSHRKR